MTLSRFARTTLLGAFTLPTGVGCQASPRDPVAFHERVSALLAAPSAVAMPSGDTLLTWRADGPILFHTAAYSGDTVRAGMRRNDPLAGAAEVIWSGGSPTSFRVSWSGQGPPFQLNGSVSEERLRLTGARDTTVVLPDVPWAVADFGMDDLLLPLLKVIPSGVPTRIAVFRPYAATWETLSAEVAVRSRFKVLTLTDNKGARTALAADEGANSFVWVRSADASGERRPLEGTARFADFERARGALGTLP